MTQETVSIAKSKGRSGTAPAHGWTFEVMADLGSGRDGHNNGLQPLVVSHLNPLLRLGAQRVFAICKSKRVEVVMLNLGENTTQEEELAQAVLETITVFFRPTLRKSSPKKTRKGWRV